MSNLTAAQEASLVGRLVDGTMPDLCDALALASNCARPVRLSGRSTTVDVQTGEVLEEYDSTDAPLGVLMRPCGNRRAEVCPACSRTYARDTYAMIRAGVDGGRTVPETVGANPLLFVTLTAPSFGLVHRATEGSEPCRRGRRSGVCAHGRPRWCARQHGDRDGSVGAPLCGDCYDWHLAVVWQWWAPELWRRTRISIDRAIARRLGVTGKQLRQVASLQYAKVAEYQARGAVHFHALVRLDGPDGPGSPAPLDGADLAVLLRDAITSTSLTARPVDGHDQARVLAWGRQVDVRVVRTGNRPDHDHRDGPLTPDQVAGYLAKYSTKDANAIREPGTPRPHLLRLAATCRQLAARDQMPDEDRASYRLLAKWAHMLGFRGHFSTKSRSYSITLGRLRRARHRYARLVRDSDRNQTLDLRELDELLLADDDDTTLVVGSWAFQGTGWPREGDEALANAAAARAREYAQQRVRERAEIK